VTYGPVLPITAAHVVDRFDCGSIAQTDWLRRHALQAHRTDSSRVRVVTHLGDPQVVGYYALAAGAVERATAPERVARGMPRHPVPVVLLTRLGVDLGEQGRGLGRALLRDALVRIAVAADEIAARALLIHCENERARAFYLHLAEFETSPTDPLHLFLLLTDLRRSLPGEE
jgi:GNAT superfamily N-acetyltransferase